VWVTIKKILEVKQEKCCGGLRLNQKKPDVWGATKPFEEAPHSSNLEEVKD